MLKNLKRIAIIILVLISVGYSYSYCYLTEILGDRPYFDGITLYSPYKEFFWDKNGWCIIGTVVLIITLILCYILRVTAKNSNNINMEEDKNNKYKIYNITMIILIIVHCYYSILVLGSEINRLVIWLIPIILFIISKAIRKPYKKVSNILGTISMCIIVVMLIYSIIWINTP